MSEIRPLAIVEKGITPHDNNFSPTYEEQDEVEENILEIYDAFHQSQRPDHPLLNKEKHGAFLRRGLVKLSDSYEALDASRPWLCYWILHSMNLLNLRITEEEKTNISIFLEKCQDPNTGGFGGGPSQISHLAATYAAINALVSLGSIEHLKVINRDLLYKFVASMKLQDGSFRMHRGGEIDVRAIYCAVVVCKLTNLDCDKLFEGTAEWVASCQTYEGGFGGFPGMEAHGGYTFCAVAALILLKRYVLIDEVALTRWLSHRQMAVEGGFQGRTNKLVDACYSFWQAACFPLLSPFINNYYSSFEEKHVPHCLFHHIALQEYILICCQHPLGGLIDKPGKQRDYYHTCYALSGLSAAQHCANGSPVLGSSKNSLSCINPLYNVTVDVAEKAQTYFDNLPVNTID